VAAPLAVGATRLDDAIGVITERSGLPPADVQPDVAAVVVDELAVLIDLTDFFELDQHLVVRAVVAEPHGSEDERRLGGLGQLEGTGHRAVLGRREVAQHLAQVLDDRSGLLLLALDRDPLALGAHLHEEGPVAGHADGAGRERVDVVELEEDAHQAGLSSVSGRPVEFTASTMGPPECQVIALTDAGLITMRWKRSMCVPIACATAALIVSA